MCKDPRLHDYLDAGVNGHPEYFKSKHVARDLGMEPVRGAKVLGLAFGALARGACPTFKVERWGYSKSTTWKVERR